MDDEILYGSLKSENGNFKILSYYIIPENISADYCDLKCYGIKIEKTIIYDGGGKTVESRQINNVFYRYGDVEEFLKNIMDKRVEPAALRDAVEKYILESIDKAKKSA